MADSRAEEWLKRSDKAFEAILPYLRLCDDLARVFYPERADFLIKNQLGAERYDALYEGYPVLMSIQLTNAIGSMSRPRGREWFRHRAAQRKLNDSQPVLAWCDEATETQRDIVYDPRAQFARQMGMSDRDEITFGTSCVKTTLNNDASGVLFRCLHLRDVAPEQNSEGELDVTHERMCYTARGLKQILTENTKLPAKLRKRIDEDPLAEIELKFCCAPVEDYEPARASRRPWRGARWFALLIDPESRTVVREEFFSSYPYLWRRWMTVSGEIVGRSAAAMAALADSRMMQEISSSLAEAIERAATPGWMVANDAVVGDVDLAPNGVTMTKSGYDYRTGAPIMPVPHGSQPAFAMELLRDKREYVARAFLQDILRLPTGEDMTAYEVAERIEEFIRYAAPLFEPEEAANALQQARVFDIADRMGAFPPRPAALQGKEISFEFETPLSLAFDKLRVQQAAQMMDSTERLAAFDPGAVRRVDWAVVQKDMMKGLGPARWLRDPKEADEEIAADAQKAELSEALMLGKASGITDLLGKADPAGGAPALPAPGAADPTGMVGGANALSAAAV